MDTGLSTPTATKAAGTLLIFIPTYNEKAGVTRLIRKIEALRLKADILVIDDDSPDGTGEALEEMARTRNDRLRVIRRPAKLGIGSAHLQAVRLAYANRYRQLITMDGDLTHAPEDIPALQMGASGDQAVVIGSRYAAGARDNRPRHERLGSWLSHWAAGHLLKLPYDVTSGFRWYDLDRIDPALFSRIRANGFDFFFESLALLRQSGITIREVPIHLEKRPSGHSKKRWPERRSWLKHLILLRLRLSSDRF